jgi:glycosyltransferase involved in cell wall biosynthesis
MKIVHVHRIRGIGGSERHVLTLLPALAARGADVAFVGLDDPGWDVAPFYRELAPSVTVKRLPSRRDVEPRLVPRVRRTLRELAPDVVHTHLVHADVYGTLASLRAPWALVSSKHNDDPFRSGAFRFAERTLARRVDAVVAITESLRRFTVERVGLPGDRVHVVHYGLDELPAAWGASAAPPEERIVLAVARLVEQKGIDVAVRALPRVRAAHPDVVLAVLGEGAERSRLEELAQELGVADALLLPGRVGDVAAWLRQAELVVHPVRWEGFGLALLEAMLAGKAVVASAVSSVPEIVADGDTGLLVRPDDPVALADALSALLGDDERRARLGEAGRLRARAEFSVERMASRTEAVYASALSRRKER